MEADRASSNGPMPETRVGIRELRHDFRAWLDRARAGERVVVTDRGRPVADLVPHREQRTWLQRMYDEGQIIRAKKPGSPFPSPYLIGGEVTTLAGEALQKQREERLP